MRLIREVLDGHVVDGNKKPLGKVDGVVLELRARGRPRVAAIQIGAPVLATRVRGPMRRIIAWLSAKWGAETMTIPWNKVREIGVDIEVHLEGERPASRAWEHWIATRVIDRIPGS